MMSGDNIKLESIVLDEDLIKDDNVFSQMREMVDRVVPYDKCNDGMDMSGISQMVSMDQPKVVYLIPTLIKSTKNVHHVIALEVTTYFVC